MMEDNFRNALIIISAIVIGAIFVHGLWTIRKNKNPYKLKAKQDSSFEQQEPKVDRSGFDQDGIGKVKVVAKTATDGANQETSQNANIDSTETNSIKTNSAAEQLASSHQADSIRQQQAEQTIEATQQGQIQQTQMDTMNQSDVATGLAQAEQELKSQPKFETDTQQPAQQYQATESREPSLGAIDDINPDNFDLAAERNSSSEAVYQAPVTQPKPQVSKSAASTRKSSKKAELKRNQMEIDFDAAGTDASKKANKPSAEIELEQEVLVISVVMPEGQAISGAALLPSLLTLGMKYGDMNIFHRHQDNAGNGKVTFSLANMMNPGTFDLDQMESFVTQGVSLFMTLPNAGDSFEVFQQMLASAKHLAQEFQGQVLDDKRSVMTKQTEQHYTSKIREFERKKRIANA